MCDVLNPPMVVSIHKVVVHMIDINVHHKIDLRLAGQSSIKTQNHEV